MGHVDVLSHTDVAMTAGNDSGRAVFHSEISECPHATDQHFHSGKAHRVDTIVAMQVLHFLAGTYFDRSEATDPIALTVRQKNGISDIHYHVVPD